MSASSSPISRKLLLEIPKTDLHVHLDGSLRLETVIELAREAGKPLPSMTPAGLRRLVFKKRFRNLNEYLKGFEYTVSVLQTPEALERAAFELAEDNQEEGVRYLEVRFAPQLHSSLDLTMAQAMQAVARGLERAARRFNARATVKRGEEPRFEFGIIVCALRHFTESYSETYHHFMRAHTNAPPRSVFAMASLELARAATRAAEGGLPIVGFDLAGREKGYPAADHWEAFQLAHESFLGKTVHAGEDYGPESIFQAITECHADRIGHGTYLFDTRRIHDQRIEDREAYIRKLTRYIGDRRVTIEVCLTSNLQTMPQLKDLKRHPFRRMRAERLSTSICTDNRLVSNTSVTEEYLKATQLFGVTHRELRDLVIYGFKRSFFARSYAEKRAYVREIIDYYDQVVARHGVTKDGRPGRGAP
ncbi:MAG: adenosine deaminase family protein [Planctomycetota bacterium]